MYLGSWKRKGEVKYILTDKDWRLPSNLDRKFYLLKNACGLYGTKKKELLDIGFHV